MKLLIPVTFPFEVRNDQEILRFKFDTNIIRSVPKEKPDIIEFEVSLEKKITITDQEIDHGGIIIPKTCLPYFKTAREPENKTWQMVITSEAGIDDDLKLILPVFLQAVLNIFGYAKVSSIIQTDEGKLLFNSRLTCLMMPGQDWFATSHLLRFSTDRSIFDQLVANESEFKKVANDYNTLIPHLKKMVAPLDWKEVSKKTPFLASNEVSSFGRVLSEICQQHPGVDYISMIGLLTSFTEGVLQIYGEHRYKFGIKISNFFSDPKLASVVKKIYDSRSSFAHSGVFKNPDNIFEFVRIEFLLLTIKKLLRANLDSPITAESYDFPV